MLMFSWEGGSPRTLIFKGKETYLGTMHFLTLVFIGPRTKNQLCAKWISMTSDKSFSPNEQSIFWQNDATKTTLETMMLAQMPLTQFPRIRKLDLGLDTRLSPLAQQFVKVFRHQCGETVWRCIFGHVPSPFAMDIFDNLSLMAHSTCLDKVNRCLARYSPRATTTNWPTNRAPKKPAWPGPNLPKMPILGQIWSFLGKKSFFLLEKSKVLLST